MIKTLLYTIALAFLISLTPLTGFGQTGDNSADKVERAHRKAVVKHRVHAIRHGARNTYHKVAKTVLSPIDKATAHHRADEKAEGEKH